jgi:hypothetical protein
MNSGGTGWISRCSSTMPTAITGHHAMPSHTSSANANPVGGQISATWSGRRTNQVATTAPARYTPTSITNLSSSRMRTGRV